MINNNIETTIFEKYFNKNDEVNKYLIIHVPGTYFYL